MMTVEEAIAAPDAILPGVAAPDGETDPRWQAVIAVAEFIETDPEPVWSFALRWGRYSDQDLQMRSRPVCLNTFSSSTSTNTSRKWKKPCSRTLTLPAPLQVARNSANRRRLRLAPLVSIGSWHWRNSVRVRPIRSTKFSKDILRGLRAFFVPS